MSSSALAYEAMEVVCKSTEGNGNALWVYLLLCCAQTFLDLSKASSCSAFSLCCLQPSWEAKERCCCETQGEVMSGDCSSAVPVRKGDALPLCCPPLGKICLFGRTKE